jgi:hypothetical protein
VTTITIIPETPGSPNTDYRAIAGSLHSIGHTPGQALDALSAQLGEANGSTWIVVQHARPDQFFTAQQQQRLTELMTRWRAARDAGAPLPAAEQTELQALVEAEVRAAGQRAAALAQGLLP